MELALDTDQLALRDVVREVIAAKCPPAFVRAVIEGRDDPSAWWATMVELDWPALAVEADAGGLGSTWIELAILLEELGHAVDPSPYLATTTQFVPIIRHCGDAGQRDRWLRGVAAGTVTGALALGASTVHAERSGDGWRLDGTCPNVVDADRAVEIAVVATTPAGAGVFVVDPAAAGATLAVAPVRAFDHTAHIANITLTGVTVDESRRLGGADVELGISAATDEATLGWSVTTVGACQWILDLTLEHVKQRRQFGVAIGSFQAVKHKLVDMYVTIERARALAQFAALTVVEHDSRRSNAVSMAKAAAGDCQELTVQHGVQLFGAMGFTWENDLQIAIRRAKLGAPLFGTTSEHHRRLARAVLL
ncbi:MAG TPA: acyl-CoA dehydrogenase family protein [Ilumatobacteraceae bacterium]